MAALRELLPEAGFIAEEGSAVYHDEPYCWVVDPLDGTTNYIHDNAPIVSASLCATRILCCWELFMTLAGMNVLCLAGRWRLCEWRTDGGLVCPAGGGRLCSDGTPL